MKTGFVFAVALAGSLMLGGTVSAQQPNYPGYSSGISPFSYSYNYLYGPRYYDRYGPRYGGHHYGSSTYRDSRYGGDRDRRWNRDSPRWDRDRNYNDDRWERHQRATPRDGRWQM